MKEQIKIWDSIYEREENKWKRETKSFNGILKGKKVLELGVGNGKTLKTILKDEPKSIVAIDFSRKAIELCKNQFKDENLQLIVGDISQLEFDDEEFDTIVCYYVLNNLNNDEKKKAVAEIYRVLSNNGIVLFEDFAKGDFRDDGKPEKSGLIKNYFSLDEIKELFCEFSGVKIEIKEFSAIKSDKNLKRRIIRGIIKK